MATVHSFRVYDAHDDDWVYPLRKSTADRIALIRGELLPGTAEDVPDDEMDADGKHVGPPRSPVGFQTQVRF